MNQPIIMPKINFIDLMAQRERLGSAIDKAVMDAVNSGAWIMGPPVGQFERELAKFGQSKFALSCANGTDAIVLPLMAWGIGPGDAVFCPSFTFAATAEVIAWTGATPVFVDIDPQTYNMDPVDLALAIKTIEDEGQLVPRVIIAVDLFGQPADYPSISKIARSYGLKLIADSAQGFGCTIHGKHPLAFSDCTTTSFFPAKPLGCYGDGGAVLTDDEDLHALMDSLRVHGKATKADIESRNFTHDPKYLNMRVGLNSRLDTIQAAILLEKLSVFAEEIDIRNAVASRYCEALADVVTTPNVIDGGVSTWAQFTIETAEGDALGIALKALGVPTATYYPIPLHLQPAFEGARKSPSGLPVTTAKASRVISLPMHPDLTPSDQSYIIDSVKSALGHSA